MELECKENFQLECRKEEKQYNTFPIRFDDGGARVYF
jgi:hypothetical protein